ncbi:MAG TPA: hypothetical protein VFU15_00250 [Bacteroidia bacterium]|nr:hypothetical protein [Bacteroidia bacterium]
MNLTKDRYRLFTGLFFLAMTIFAIVFAGERFQADGAYYLFHVVDSGNFRIEHQRYILAVSQALPLLGVKLGLSMHAVILLNSLNNIVFFFLVFLYAVRYLHDRTAGIAVILFQVLGVMHIQFIPMYEVWYGSVLLVLVRSHLLHNRYRSIPDFVLLTAIMVTVLFSHPLLFIPLIFIILLDAIEKRKISWKLLFTYAVIFSGWYIIKKLFLSEYEAGKLSLLDFGWNKAYRNLFHFGYLWGLVVFFFKYYTIPVLAFIFMMIVYIVRRAKMKAFLLAAFFFGIILLINITNENIPEISPYFERMYMPLIPISLLPFLYDFFAQFGWKSTAGGILVMLVVTWRIYLFCSVGMMYSERTAITERVIHQAQAMGGSKFELAESDYRGCMSWVDWSYPMETFLRSACDGKDKTVTVLTSEDLDEGRNRQMMNDRLFFLRRWDPRADYFINKNYFVVKDGPYKKLQPECR